MILLELFLAFLMIGTFSFGGAYAAIPLIQDVVIQHGWMNEAMFTNVIAISESTPGPIMVNMATYVGSRQAGILGAVIATIGVVLPSFLLLLLITALFQNWIKHNKVQAVLKGIKPCLMGVILATGISMSLGTIIDKNSRFGIEPVSCLIIVLLLIGEWLYQKGRKRGLSPILLIVLGGILGMIFY